jgi:hypothetical protein
VSVWNFSAQLATLEADHRLRVRRTMHSAQGPHPVIDGQRMLSFASNDYLGLAAHPAVVPPTFCPGTRRPMQSWRNACANIRNLKRR